MERSPREEKLCSEGVLSRPKSPGVGAYDGDRSQGPAWEAIQLLKGVDVTPSRHRMRPRSLIRGSSYVSFRPRDLPWTGKLMLTN